MFNNIDDIHNKSMAIIGCGPRGISVLERFSVLLSSYKESNVECLDNLIIYIIDAVEVGAGRVWRENQPDWFLMNTPARETTMFSGLVDGTGIRPGAGPSLSQWWAEVDPLNSEPDGLAPRAVYGKYLHFVFDKIIENLSKFATVELIRDTVIDLEKTSDQRWQIAMQNEKVLFADRVVLTTGHSLPGLNKDHSKLHSYAKLNKGLNYIRGDSAADIDLTEIYPGSNIGMIGCGLAFYDLMASLTEGRGGNFIVKEDGQYKYEPSGLEPIIYAGSRSGVPFPARAVNEKPADYSYIPLLLTKKRIEQLHKFRKNEKLDFQKDVLPWLEAEMQLVQSICVIKNMHGEDLVKKFIEYVI
ncbi:MAG TPA: FAD/NAD(P)-binding protein, partial [Aquella sp.]|nr:FAD/NAD(P)-binding protein [Aquella sp.]